MLASHIFYTHLASIRPMAPSLFPIDQVHYADGSPACRGCKAKTPSSANTEIAHATKFDQQYLAQTFSSIDPSVQYEDAIIAYFNLLW